MLWPIGVFYDMGMKSFGIAIDGSFIIAFSVIKILTWLNKTFTLHMKADSFTGTAVNGLEIYCAYADI